MDPSLVLLILLAIIGIGMGIQAEYQKKNRNPEVIKNVILSLLLSLVYVPVAHTILNGSYNEYGFLLLGALALFEGSFMGLELRLDETTKKRVSRALMATMLIAMSIIVLL